MQDQGNWRAEIQRQFLESSSPPPDGPSASPPNQVLHILKVSKWQADLPSHTGPLVNHCNKFMRGESKVFNAEACVFKQNFARHGSVCHNCTKGENLGTSCRRDKKLPNTNMGCFWASPTVCNCMPSGILFTSASQNPQLTIMAMEAGGWGTRDNLPQCFTRGSYFEFFAWLAQKKSFGRVFWGWVFWGVGAI